MLKIRSKLKEPGPTKRKTIAKAILKKRYSSSKKLIFLKNISLAKNSDSKKIKKIKAKEE